MTLLEILSVLTVAVTALGQSPFSIDILSPANGTDLFIGDDVTVQVGLYTEGAELPHSTFDPISLVLSMQACSDTSQCSPVDTLENILYVGPYDPTEVDSSTISYQSVTVAVPPLTEDGGVATLTATVFGLTQVPLEHGPLHATTLYGSTIVTVGQARDVPQ